MTNDVQVEPVLYILMRTDMDSMNPGKAMAQASHASNAFVHRHSKNLMTKQWQEQTPDGFGTVIVLGVGGEMELTYCLGQADDLASLGVDIVSGEVVDPTYPVGDGLVTHLVEMVTCGYIFMDRNDTLVRRVVQDLKLHE
tara:strand:+ start:3092 stop:3511 length:420 start_codon:yes stop_codon:yes gene_type:complete